MSGSDVADPVTVIESKPPIILVYSKMFVFARSRRLGRVISSYLGMFWDETFRFYCKKSKVQKVCIILFLKFSIVFII